VYRSDVERSEAAAVERSGVAARSVAEQNGVERSLVLVELLYSKQAVTPVTPKAFIGAVLGVTPFTCCFGNFRHFRHFRHDR
jgi:hypothetical protein